MPLHERLKTQQMKNSGARSTTLWDADDAAILVPPQYLKIVQWHSPTDFFKLSHKRSIRSPQPNICFLGSELFSQLVNFLVNFSLVARKTKRVSLLYVLISIVEIMVIFASCENSNVIILFFFFSSHLLSSSFCFFLSLPIFLSRFFPLYFSFSYLFFTACLFYIFLSSSLSSSLSVSLSSSFSFLSLSFPPPYLFLYLFFCTIQ